MPRQNVADLGDAGADRAEHIPLAFHRGYG